MGATAARRRRAAGALLAAVLAAGAVGGCAGQGLVDLTPRILPDKSCDGLAESVCIASENCFFNKAANKCGPFALPCSQYQTPSACQARPGCKGIMVPRCLPASRPAPPKPAENPGCQGLRKKKCKKNSTCNWNTAQKYAFGRAKGCTDKMPNGCVPLQLKKMCNSNAACTHEKIFHCVSRAQITPPTCDCSKEGSVCDACYSL